MSPVKFVLSDAEVRDLFQELSSNISLTSIRQLTDLNGWGGNKYNTSRKRLYEIFGKKSIEIIFNQRRWSPERRAISREAMLKNAPKGRTVEARTRANDTRRANGWPGHTDKWRTSVLEANARRITSDETREKMSKSAIKRGGTYPEGYKASPERRKQISDNTKKQWKEGIHVFSPVSKGQRELFEAVCEVYSASILSCYVLGKEYDIYVPELNLLIEFNGTYWHYDPRKFAADHYDESKKRFAREVWASDEKKASLARENGFLLAVVWQDDWNGGNRASIVEDLLNV